MKNVYPYIRVGTYEQAGTTEEAELLRKRIEAAMDARHTRIAVALWNEKRNKK